MKLLLSLFVVLAFAVESARAVEVPGTDEPAFAEARDLYLSGEVVPAVRALAKIAPDNDAAALLLGLIDTDDLDPELRALSTKEQRALLRAPSGRFGRSWLLERASHSHLNSLFDKRGKADPLAVARSFVDVDELGEAARSYLTAFNHGQWDEILQDYRRDLLPPELHWLAWGSAVLRAYEGRSNPTIVRAKAEASASITPWAAFAAAIAPRSGGATFKPHSIVFGSVFHAPTDAPERDLLPLLDAWLAEQDEFVTHRAVCERFCSKTQRACRRGAYMATGGMEGVLVLATPSENLIPQSRWAASARAQNRLLERAAADRNTTSSGAARAALLDDHACFARLLALE